jgi:hypothetical protein
MSGERDIRAVMASAAMNASIEANRAEDGTATVDPQLAEQAMALVVAMLMEADPGILTRRDMREAADRFSKIVRLQVEAFREEHERSGRRGWDSVPMTRQ